MKKQKPESGKKKTYLIGPFILFFKVMQNVTWYLGLCKGMLGVHLTTLCEVWTGVSYRSRGPGASCTGILPPERSRAPAPAARSQCPGCAPRSRACRGQSPAGPSVSPPAGQQRPECVRAPPRPELHHGDLSGGQRSALIFINPRTHPSTSNFISRDLWAFDVYAMNCRPHKAVISTTGHHNGQNKPYVLNWWSGLFIT